MLLVANAQAHEPPHKETVVLIHGLMRTSLSMLPLKIFLERRGYEVTFFTYHSPFHSLHEHALHLQAFVEQKLAENPKTKLHFVTHSMGGVIAREAVSALGKRDFDRIGCLVMMAPPNQGSYLAELSTRLFPPIAYLIKPLPELSAEKKAYVHSVPVPSIKMGIIAGRYDAKVPPASAVLKGQREMALVDSTHTFIMVNPQSMRLIHRFLQRGSFAA